MHRHQFRFLATWPAKLRILLSRERGGACIKPLPLLSGRLARILEIAGLRLHLRPVVIRKPLSRAAFQIALAPYQLSNKTCVSVPATGSKF
jgi:hypothetical protein